MIKKLKLKRNEKMARTRSRIKKMTFQTQDRRQLQQELVGIKQDEKIPRITGGGL